MKLTQWYIDKINESATVKIVFSKHPSTWKLQITVIWDSGFESNEVFDSLSETNAYLRGFYNALPF